MNKWTGIGNLTRDPELRKTQSDASVCTFTIACSRRFKNSNGEREADFLPITVWRAQADSCYRYLKKGSRVAVSGSVQTRSYEDKDGNRRTVTEIIADEVEFINVRTEQQVRKTTDDYGAEVDGGDALAGMTPVSGEDLPF